jgi:hypothetical protein
MTIEFAYAQARVQARLGERLAPAAWQVLDASGSLSQYLHAARTTALRHRVQSLTAASSPHMIERGLRREWRGEVAGVAGWVPEPWRPAIEWTAWLCDLPALAALGLGGEVLPWMAEDTALAPFAVGDAAIRQREIDAAGLGALSSRDDILAAWRYRFELLWPAGDRDRRRLEDFVDRVDGHRGEPLTAQGMRMTALQALESLAVRLIRQNLRQPVTVMSHLLLVALDLGRLRGGLVRRALHSDRLAA